MRDEKLDRVATDGDAMSRKGVADDVGEVAGAVGVAADGDAAWRALEQATQRAARRQIAGLDHGQSVARRIGEETAENRALGIADFAHANQSSAAHQTD